MSPLLGNPQQAVFLFSPTIPNQQQPGGNFTNVLREAFLLVDPISVKTYSQVIGIFLRFWDLRK